MPLKQCHSNLTPKILLIFGFLIMLGGTAAAPYIYSLFQVLRWRTPGVMAVVSSERPHFVLFSRMSRALPFSSMAFISGL